MPKSRTAAAAKPAVCTEAGKKPTAPAEQIVEDNVFVDASRYRRRSSPGMRAFEGASMGGPERYTREEMTQLIDHADEFVQKLGEVLKKYVPESADPHAEADASNPAPKVDDSAA